MPQRTIPTLAHRATSDVVVVVMTNGVKIFVEVVGSSAVVRDADNCQELDVRVPGRAPTGDDDLTQALTDTGLGSWDGGPTVELDVAKLHDLAAANPVGPDWPARWAAMVAYAGNRGWLTADGQFVRAHLREPKRA